MLYGYTEGLDIYFHQPTTAAFCVISSLTFSSMTLDASSFASFLMSSRDDCCSKLADGRTSKFRSVREASTTKAANQKCSDPKILTLEP